MIIRNMLPWNVLTVLLHGEYRRQSTWFTVPRVSSTQPIITETSQSKWNLLTLKIEGVPQALTFSNSLRIVPNSHSYPAAFAVQRA